MAARKGVVDVLKHLHHLRQQRANLVDNIEQYKLTHLVLLECLVAPKTIVSCNEEMEGVVLRLLESDAVAQQMQYLVDTAWQDEVMRPPLTVTRNPEGSTKNQDGGPCGSGHVDLSWDPACANYSTYSAVAVDRYRSSQIFIVTQQPLRNTVSNFWRLVYEKKVTTIVSLNEINMEDRTRCKFWPTARDSTIQLEHFLTLKFRDKSDTEHYVVLTVQMYNNKDEENTKRIVNLILLKGWPANKLLPNEENSLLKLWEKNEKISKGSAPVVVTCYDGAKACGLFVALSFIIEKMKFEHECDVCLAVRTVRRNCKQFVTAKDQYSFLYLAAVNYLNCFDMYSNFKELR